MKMRGNKIMKKIVSCILVFVLVFTSFVDVPKKASADENKYGEITFMNESDFETEVIDGKFTLTKYNGTYVQNMAVPAYVNGKKVEALGKGLFMGTSQVIRIFLPDTLEIIGEECFKGIGMQLVGSYTYSLTGDAASGAAVSGSSLGIMDVKYSDYLPSMLREIGASAFEMANLNMDMIVVNSHIKKIGERAFAEACNLQQFVVLKNAQIDYVDAYAFSKNTLHEVHVYGKIDVLGVRSFEAMPNLTDFIVEEGGAVRVISECCFYGSSALHYVVLRGLEVINAYAFSDCMNMENIYVESNGAYTIGPYAFKGTAIHNVNLAPGIAVIEKGTFEDCKNIVTIHLPETVNTIKEDAFKNLNTLIELTISDKAIVDPKAFTGASSVTLATLRKTKNVSILKQLGINVTPVVKKPVIPTIAKVKLKKIKLNKKKKKATLTWSKSANAKGYIIYKKVVKKGKKASKCKFKKCKTIKSNKCKYVAKLKKKTTTYFYVKAYGYVLINNVSVKKYSLISNKKKVKLK